MKSIVNQITEEDIRQAQTMAEDIAMETRGRHTIPAFDNSPALLDWASDASDCIKRTCSMGTSDPKMVASILEEVIDQYLLTAFMIAYTFSTKVTAATLGGTPMSDTLRAEMWARGYLDNKHYQFDPGDDPELKDVLRNRKDVLALAARVEKYRGVKCPTRDSDKVTAGIGEAAVLEAKSGGPS